MPGTCVIGLQWGDEAKGKIVDLLTADARYVVRYQGGANAGHTVCVGDEVYKLSLLPSGVLTQGVTCVITGGVVLNPAKVLEEIDELAGRGVPLDGSNLKISDRTHVILPWHFAEDRILDTSTGGESIGTTQRGIGPCYRDKVARSHAIRMGDMYRGDFRQRIEHITEAKNRVLAAISDEAFEPLDPDAIYNQYASFAKRLAPYVCDTTEMLLTSLEQGERVLFEGAQGSLLDVDHGTYPYVTSSNSSGVGISNGSGVPAKYINKVLGVVKAYSTRVGGGPFPSELDDATGQYLRDRGNEYGTVTRRPRRCGWLDTVAIRYTARLGGVDGLCVMLMDVLSGLDELLICTQYEIDGKRTTTYPSHVDDLRRVKPVYESVPGWQEEIDGIRSYAGLPQAARDYLDRIAELVGCPVEVVSVGPKREQTIVLNQSLLGV